MAVDFGSENASRYYRVDDNALLTLPVAGDGWTWLVAGEYTGTTTHPSYPLSTNPLATTNSFNVYKNAFSLAFSAAINTQTQNAPANSLPVGGHRMMYSRNGGVDTSLFSGTMSTTGTDILQSVTSTQSAGSNGGNLFIGSRNDLNVDRFWRGTISWVALLNIGLTQEQIADLVSNGNLTNAHGANIVELWDFATAAPTITGLYAGLVATRFGTDYGADLPDLIPHTQASSAMIVDAGVALVTVSPLVAQVIQQTDVIITAAPAVITITALPAEIIQQTNVVVNATPAAITITALAAAVVQQTNTIINATPAAVTVTALPATVTIGADVVVSAAPAEITITALAAEIIQQTNVVVNATPATITITPLSATVTLGADVVVSAAPTSISVVPAAAQVLLQEGMVVNASAAQITVAPASAQIIYLADHIINAQPQHIMVVGNTVVVVAGLVVPTTDAGGIVLNLFNETITLK